MVDPDPIGADVRRAKSKRAVGPEAACACCGERNPLALTTVKAGVLQRHHVAGRVNDPELEVVLCLNCHQLNTVAQMDFGVEFSRHARGAMPERLVSVLRGLAAFFDLLARRLVAWADGLAALTVALDGNFPEWRALPEARMENR
jgi:hypothetical protein